MTPEERAKQIDIDLVSMVFDSKNPDLTAGELREVVREEIFTKHLIEAQREAVEKTVRLVEHQYRRCSSLMNGHDVFQKVLRELTPEKVLLAKE